MPPEDKTMTEENLPMQANGVPEIASVKKTINKRMRRKQSKWTLIVTFLSLVLIIILITVAYLVSKGLFQEIREKVIPEEQCQDELTCRIEVVETMPSVMSYPAGSPTHPQTADVWKKLTAMATERIEILSFYWTMKNFSYHQAQVGAEILLGLKEAAQRGIQVRIVQNTPNARFPNLDTKELAELDNVEVRSLSSDILGGGVLHTKLWIVDREHVYVGSANFDWRSLTEVKELGAAFYNCSCAGQDLFKIFDTNWLLAQPGAKIPSPWPEQYTTKINKDNPQIVELPGGLPLRFYWSTSPPSFCAPERTSDIDAIMDLIGKAERYIYIAVMDYYAAMIYKDPKLYWSVIDEALRKAAFDRGLKVYLLSSRWPHTSGQQTAFIKSLNEFGKMPYINGSIEVREFEMPTSSIPFARVNHNKYMVTDKGAFISTSNWSGDYFTSTGGVSLVVNQTESSQGRFKDQIIQAQLESVFLRDWHSQYSHPLS